MTWLLCCAACSSKAPPAAPTPPPPVAGQAGSATGSQAGATAPTPTTRELVSRTAAAELAPLAGASLQLRGTASFRTTTEGVDLSVELLGCTGGQQYALQILDAASCSPEVMQAPVWSGGRGSHLPPVFCIGVGMVAGATSYARLAGREDAWTIGDAAESELTGRVLVVLDADSGELLACGTITRTADLVRVPVPPATEPPRIETRAALAGVCFGRMFAGSGPGCPSDQGVYECTNVHCDLGGCFEKCAAHLSCLDAQTDACAPAACELTPECAQCQAELMSCGLGFCAEHLACAPAITPDGPCQQLAACCVLQGDHADSCLGVLTPLITSLGGDANCIGSMNDWDVLSHMHVPCKFGPPATGPAAPDDPGVPAPSAEPRLAEGVAGKACETDAQCPGGHCETAAAAGTGYCTRACVASYECGADGICASTGERGADRRCLAKCQLQQDCREGFLCAGGLRGARLNVPGGCRPYRSVSSLADGVAGRACVQDAECAGGQCASRNLLGTSYPGNYCTGRCYADEHCGQGGVCAWPEGFADPGHCLQACETDADCTREGYGCWQMGDGTRVLHACYPRVTPLPDGRVGQPCTEALDCGSSPGASCATMLPFAGFSSNDLTEAPEGYCTQPCALDAECGAGGQCINHGTDGGLCLARCSDDEPCRSGYTCITHDRDGDPTAAVCVPTDPTTP